MTEDTFPREPFSSLARQHQAASFGMWVFLASEILLFSGLFAGYAVYRGLYSRKPRRGRPANRHRPWHDQYGDHDDEQFRDRRRRSRRRGPGWTARVSAAGVATFLMGTTFLVLKGFEYREDIGKHLVPGPGSRPATRARNCSSRITG